MSSERLDERLDEKTREALELVNDFAREKKADFQGIVSEKYGHLKAALAEASEKLKGQARETLARGEEAAKGFAAAIDKDVRRNPWPYLGGTAAGALVLGFLLGGHKRPRPSR